MPSSCSARITRTAISPRFAIRTRLNTASEGVQGPREHRLEVEERLAELDGLSILDVDRADNAFDLGLDLVHQLHRLEDAERLARRDGVADLDEGRRTRLSRPVEDPDHRR